MDGSCRLWINNKELFMSWQLWLIFALCSFVVWREVYSKNKKGEIRKEIVDIIKSIEQDDCWHITDNRMWLTNGTIVVIPETGYGPDAFCSFFCGLGHIYWVEEFMPIPKLTFCEKRALYHSCKKRKSSLSLAEQANEFERLRTGWKK